MLLVEIWGLPQNVSGYVNTFSGGPNMFVVILESFVVESLLKDLWTSPLSVFGWVKNIAVGKPLL